MQLVWAFAMASPTTLLDSALVAGKAASAAKPILLVHIEKTGGTSVDSALGLDTDYSLGTPECSSIPSIKQSHIHLTAEAAQRLYDPAVWDGAYKIAFVRNPWNRVVSYWAFTADQANYDWWRASIESGTNVELILDTCGCTPVVANEVGQAPVSYVHTSINSDPSLGNASYACSFTAFMLACADASLEITEEAQLNGVVQNITWSTFTAPSQLDWLVASKDRPSAAALTEENSLVDFVGRNENLQEHFYAALVAAGNDEAVARACADSLPNDNSVWHDTADKYFGTAKVMSRAADLFRKDAETFGYAFNESGPVDVIFRR